MKELLIYSAIIIVGVLASDVIASPNRYYRLNGSGSDTTATDDGSDAENGTLNNFTGTYWVAY